MQSCRCLGCQAENHTSVHTVRVHYLCEAWEDTCFVFLICFDMQLILYPREGSVFPSYLTTLLPPQPLPLSEYLTFGWNLAFCPLQCSFCDALPFLDPRAISISCFLLSAPIFSIFLDSLSVVHTLVFNSWSSLVCDWCTWAVGRQVEGHSFF